MRRISNLSGVSKAGDAASGLAKAISSPGVGHAIDPAKLLFSEKIAGQMPKRGWTVDSIRDLVKNPALSRSSPSIIHHANGNPVTYFYRPDGHYVVIDDITGEVVQVSDTFDAGWIDAMTNATVSPRGADNP